MGMMEKSVVVQMLTRMGTARELTWPFVRRWRDVAPGEELFFLWCSTNGKMGVSRICSRKAAGFGSHFAELWRIVGYYSCAAMQQ